MCKGILLTISLYFFLKCVMSIWTLHELLFHTLHLTTILKCFLSQFHIYSSGECIINTCILTFSARNIYNLPRPAPNIFKSVASASAKVTCHALPGSRLQSTATPKGLMTFFTPKWSVIVLEQHCSQVCYALDRDSVIVCFACEWCVRLSLHIGSEQLNKAVHWRNG